MNKTWTANWIGMRDCPGDHAPVFRKNFTLDKKGQCRLFISGLGTYVCVVNGKRVGEDILQPAFSNYDKTVYYNEYFLDDYVSCGENVIEVTLGNYFYNEQQKTAWDFDHAPWKDFPRLIAEIYLDEKLIVKTDRTWDCARSKTVFNSLRFGEKYDAMYPVRYLDKAEVVIPPGGILQKQTIAPIRVSGLYTPCIIETASRATVYDFGVNISGNVEIKGRAKPGAKLTVTYFERLLENKWPDLHYINAGLKEDIPGQTDEYIFSGEGVEVWHSEFGYNGFRYVMVQGEYDELELTGRCFHTCIEENGGIECESELIKKIHSAVKRSSLTNYHHIPTDCPHREKIGWTGDAWVSAEQMLFDFDVSDAYEKWMKDFRESQLANGKVPCIVPSNGWGYSFMDNGPSFDIAIILLPWQMYRYSGNKRYLEDNYEAMLKYLEYMSFLSEDGLCSVGIGDWLALWHRGDTIPNEAIITMLCGYATDVFLRISKKLGRTDGIEFAEKLYSKIKTAFVNKYSDYDIDNQLFYAAMLAFGFTSNRVETLEKLEQTVKNADYHICGGLFTSKFLLDTLTLNGKFDMAYKIASKRDFPGWGYLADKSSGTLGEDWFGGNSGNHHFLSEIVAWYYKALAGFNIDDDAPGFKNIILRPHVPEDMGFFKAWHKTPLGHLEISWDEENINIEIPQGTTADFSYKEYSEVLAGGKYVFKR